MGEGTWTGADRGECWTAWRLCVDRVHPGYREGEFVLVQLSTSRRQRAQTGVVAARPACLSFPRVGQRLTPWLTRLTTHRPLVPSLPLALVHCHQGPKALNTSIWPHCAVFLLLFKYPEAFKSVVVWFGLVWFDIFDYPELVDPSVVAVFVVFSWNILWLLFLFVSWCKTTTKRMHAAIPGWWGDPTCPQEINCGGLKNIYIIMGGGGGGDEVAPVFRVCRRLSAPTDLSQSREDVDLAIRRRSYTFAAVNWPSGPVTVHSG